MNKERIFTTTKRVSSHNITIIDKNCEIVIDDQVVLVYTAKDDVIINLPNKKHLIDGFYIKN